MKKHTNTLIIILLFSLLYFSTIMAGCSRESEEDDGNNTFSISGTIVDADNLPLAGVRVTGDGVEAKNITDSEGKFTIDSPFEFQEDVIITASMPGYKSYFSGGDETPDEAGSSSKNSIKVQMRQQSDPSTLEVHEPAENAIIGLDEDCTAEVDVNGVVNFKERDNYLVDVIFLVDASGSTNDVILGNQTIFEIEIQAVKKVLDKLSHDVTRVGIIRFAADADIKKSLTSDVQSVKATLDEMKDEGPEPFGQSQSGTNFYSALLKALDEFNDSPFTIQSSDEEITVTLNPQKLVVMVSDGIPTLPARPGISQEKEDLDAALDAAIELKNQGIIVHTYAIGLEDDKKRMSALPSISDITAGNYVEVADLGHLEFVMPEQSLVGMGTLIIKNLSTNTTTEVSPNADGYFSAAIPVVYGTQTLRVTAFDYHNFDSISKEIQINGILTSEISGDPWGLTESPVSSPSDIKTPSGDAMPSDEVYDLFAAEYPNIYETIGSEVFLVPGASDENIVITGELVYKHACYTSDIGYLVIDPLNFSGSADEAFGAATADNILINTSAAGTSCNKLSLDPGDTDVSFEFTVKGGSYLVFFLIPDGTLSQAQSGKKSVLYSISSLNPGGFDQALSFYTASGRRNAGTPQCIFSFEDVPLAYQSDSDFADIVFNVEGILPWRIAHECQN